MSVCLFVNESVCLCDYKIRQFRALTGQISRTYLSIWVREAMYFQVVYSGKEQGFRVSNLEPLTNYTFNVSNCLLTKSTILIKSGFDTNPHLSLLNFSCWNFPIAKLIQTSFTSSFRITFNKINCTNILTTYQVRVVTADGYVIESEPARKKAGSKGKVRSSTTGNINKRLNQSRSLAVTPRPLTTFYWENIIPLWVFLFLFVRFQSLITEKRILVLALVLGVFRWYLDGRRVTRL